MYGISGLRVNGTMVVTGKEVTKLLTQIKRTICGVRLYSAATCLPFIYQIRVARFGIFTAVERFRVTSSAAMLSVGRYIQPDPRYTATLAWRPCTSVTSNLPAPHCKQRRYVGARL